ncbi:MAG: S41 family peptidase [Acidobacteriota bacterium]
MAIAPLLFLLLIALPLGAQTRHALDLKSFDKVWSTVRDTHWEKRPGGLDWDAIGKEYRPRVEAAATSDEARTVMREMLGRLRQTHFGIFSEQVYDSLEDGDGPSGSGETGLDVRPMEGQVVVVSIQPGSPAERAGVHLGWVVQSVNGRPLEPLIVAARQNPDIHVLQLTRSFLARLSGPVGGQLDVEFLDGRGERVPLRLGLAAPRGELAEFGNLPPQRVWYEEKRLGVTAYVRFNVFLDIPRVIPGFGRTLQGCKPCDGLVIDLRGNPGGIGGMAAGMAGFLVEKTNQKLGTMYMRDATLNFVINPRPDVFGGPVAVLIDGTSASTAEIFAGGLQALGRARVFGTRSAAAALPSLLTRLPNGDGFQYAVANYISQDGKPLEGVGVTPDEEVLLNRRTLLAGQDAVLDRALVWIQEQKGK